VVLQLIQSVGAVVDEAGDGPVAGLPTASQVNVTRRPSGLYRAIWSPTGL
jgi:hypothetical protein